MSLCVSDCVEFVSELGKSGRGLHDRDSQSPSSSSVALPVLLSLFLRASPSTLCMVGRSGEGTRDEVRDCRVYRSIRAHCSPSSDEKFGVSPWGPMKPPIQRYKRQGLLLSGPQRHSHIYSVTLSATQENMDLFTLTLAWSHILTVRPDTYTKQPHSFRLTQLWDRITNTHTPA